MINESVIRIFLLIGFFVDAHAGEPPSLKEYLRGTVSAQTDLLFVGEDHQPGIERKIVPEIVASFFSIKQPSKPCLFVELDGALSPVIDEIPKHGSANEAIASLKERYAQIVRPKYPEMANIEWVDVWFPSIIKSIQITKRLNGNVFFVDMPLLRDKELGLENFKKWMTLRNIWMQSRIHEHMASPKCEIGLMVVGNAHLTARTETLTPLQFYFRKDLDGITPQVLLNRHWWMLEKSPNMTKTDLSTDLSTQLYGIYGNFDSAAGLNFYLKGSGRYLPYRSLRNDIVLVRSAR